MTIGILTIGYLTGSTEVKYFPQVLLGLAKFRIFPVTENLMPEGSVTVVNVLGLNLLEGTTINLLYFLISSKSAMTSLGDSCNDFESLGINSA